MTIENAISLFIIACEADNTPKTVRWKFMTTRSMINYFNSLDNVTSLDKITVDMIHSFIISERKRGLQPVTINKKITLLRDLFDYHDIQFDWTKIKKIPVNYRTRDRLSDDQLIEFFKYLETLPEELNNNFVYKTLFYFILDSGTRITETLFILKSNIDFKNNEIKLTEEIKFKKERYVYFTDFSKPYLKKLFELSDNKYLFVNILKDRQMDYDSDVQYFYRKLRDDLGTSGFTAHLLRHTFASISLQNGMNILSLQQILGHSSIRSTQVYIHANRTKTKRDFDRYSIINGEYLEQLNLEKKEP